MSDLIERAKAALEEHKECWDANGTWLGDEVTPLEGMAEELATRILADAEALKAADALAEAASKMMEQCEDGDGYTEGTAIALDCGIAAYRKARGGE